MAARYLVGGSPGLSLGWDTTSKVIWSTTSGGAGGATVPTSADDVFIDANSGSGFDLFLFTAVPCKSLTISNGSFTFNGGGFTLSIFGDFIISGTPPSLIDSTIFSFDGSGSSTLTTNGAALTSEVFVNGRSVTLGSALNVSSSVINVISGGLTTNNYAVTAGQLWSSNSNVRTINLGSSTVTLSGYTNAVDFSTSTNLTFNAGTSQINCNTTAFGFTGGGMVFYNVSFTSLAGAGTMRGANTFNNLSVVGRASGGISSLQLAADQTINGTLTISPGVNATARTFLRSDTSGTPRTLTCAAVASMTDIDFRDITIAGAAAPVSGTRLGDCKGNSGITFDAPKTVYWRSGTNANWGSSVWSATSGGTADLANFPLPQDTAVFPSSPTPYPTSGNTATINAAYNIGTIDMSARTSNTMTLATSTNTPTIYGNWINGTGTTLTGTGTLTFAGRGSQTITSAGKTFTQRVTADSPGGSVTLQDALNTSLGSSTAFNHVSGTFDANGYNVTISGASGGFASQGAATRTISLGSGTWTLSGTGGWNISGSNLTVTGTGTISLTSASAKTFAGGGIQTYPTLNQGGTGTLTVTGSNKFAGLTNTAIGRIQFTGGTTNEFGAFNLNGAAGTPLTLGSTNTTQAILKKPTAWLMGLLSTDAGNNTGLTFLATDGTMEYLTVSYINGQVVSPAVTYRGNFFAFF